MSKKAKTKRDAQWAEAKRKCRLNAEAVRMAKELGFSPRSLLKNIPGKFEPWKTPVHVWIREMYDKRMAATARRRAGDNERPIDSARNTPVVRSRH